MAIPAGRDTQRSAVCIHRALRHTAGGRNNPRATHSPRHKGD
nr:MAG TPA: hypothetical protein [Caudoviricetes sp.]